MRTGKRREPVAEIEITPKKTEEAPGEESQPGNCRTSIHDLIDIVAALFTKFKKGDVGFKIT